jgi:hypothetical protein
MKEKEKNKQANRNIHVLGSRVAQEALEVQKVVL